ncbi:MAG: hypothetical protein KKB81_01295 [Candidatus Margulisbacteria bacterium]|nr:hypothetical protein [Candidatus Margulisiibacteriota bacterium]MBU1021550.1 hypothetical protein [Candidatus Margulisiibacteriota bacterium]MBU1728701.1 hypothetical protein [Candidatus Margulisiibacteriota bacterium]MBU1955152.1 hypothetical protein [Candidatus Margulisiibacteriota bacterium]
MAVIDGKLNIAGKYFRGGRAPGIREAAHIFRQRGEAGRLLRTGCDSFAVMRSEDAGLTVPERVNRLMLSRQAMTRIMCVPEARITPLEILFLSDLGVVEEIIVPPRFFNKGEKSRRLEFLIGIRADQNGRDFLDVTTGRENYRVNAEGLAVGLTRHMAEEIISAINVKTTLGVRFPASNESRYLSVAVRDEVWKSERRLRHTGMSGYFLAKDPDGTPRIQGLRYSVEQFTETKDNVDRDFGVVLAREIML